MRLSTIGSRAVVSAAPNATAAEIARLMGDRSVGSVLVVQHGHLVGIVTDRDLVLRVMAKGLDPRKVTVEDVMSSPVVCAAEEDGPHEAAASMREHKLRRLPILAKGGEILGILTFDDLVHHLGRTHAEMSEAIATFPVPYQGGQPSRDRGLPHDGRPGADAHASGAKRAVKCRSTGCCSTRL